MQRELQPARLRCIVVDDHAAIRAGVRCILMSAGIDVIGDAGDGPAAIELARRRQPDVVVMDVRMKGMSGLEASEEIRRSMPAPGVMILSAHGGPGLVSEAMRCGASGYLLKTAHPAELVRAVRVVAAGGVYLDRSHDCRSDDGERLAALSGREREVLELFAAGCSCSDVAARLYLSPLTVRTHVRNARQKLSATTRTEAVAQVIRAELIS